LHNDILIADAGDGEGKFIWLNVEAAATDGEGGAVGSQQRGWPFEVRQKS
jgi:hypothetical protein